MIQINMIYSNMIAKLKNTISAFPILDFLFRCKMIFQPIPISISNGRYMLSLLIL